MCMVIQDYFWNDQKVLGKLVKIITNIHAPFQRPNIFMCHHLDSDIFALLSKLRVEYLVN